MGMGFFNEMYITSIPVSRSLHEHYKAQSFELSADPGPFMDMGGDPADGFGFLLVSS